MTKKRLRRLFAAFTVGLAVLVALGVWIAQQFPSLTSGPKSSAEILEGLFKTPAHMVAQPRAFILEHVNQAAVELFIRACDLPSDEEGRLLDLVRGERFDEVTIPFVFFLYELYGAPAQAEAVTVGDLAYAETIEPEQDGKDRPGLSVLVQRSLGLRRHVSRGLRLFDALFLQAKPGTIERDLPRRDRYDGMTYKRVQQLVREVADDFLIPADDAMNEETEENEYRDMLEEVLNDDERLDEFVEFFTDFIRQQSDSWLQSFVQRQHRKQARLDWVQDRMNRNRYYEIADYARDRSARKMAVHVVVDGLQGKLLEGLVQLSSGEREGSGARYLAELVRLHQSETMDPSRYGPNTKPPLGQDIIELVEGARNRPDYLENFKRYFFSTQAPAVTVNVATVDTPSISVRNLPIIKTGHGVAGPFGTGIPNFSYLDRASARGWYFWGSDVLHMRRIIGNHEDEILQGKKRPEGPGARTLFERLWRYNTVSSMATVDTAALERIAAEVGMAIGEVKRNYIEKVLLLRFRRRARMERELNERRRWLQAHRGLSYSFLGSLIHDSIDLRTFHDYARFLAEHEDAGLPDYLLWYNPWPDHFAHAEGPYSDPIIGFEGEYDRLDFYLGRLIEVYESVETADGRANYADRTLFGVVSDHGLVYTPRLVSTDQLLFDAMRAEGIRISYQKLTHDEGGLPAIHGRRNVKPTRPFDAVVGSTAGGSYIIDLFDIQGLQGDDAAWQRHPGYHALRSHRLLSGQTIDWIEQIKRRLKDTMDFALIREYGPRTDKRWPAEIESVVRIITPDRGEARVYRIRKGDDKTGWTVLYRYEALAGQDPLDLVAGVREYLITPGGRSIEQIRRAIRECMEAAEGCEDRQWQGLLSTTLRPDVVYQFSHLYDSSRAGTINLFPLRHVGMNSNVNGRHAGEAFGEKNGTQLYFGARLKRASVQTARNGSLPVTLYHWLVGDERFNGGESGVSPAEQFGYPSLMDESALESIR